MILNAQGFPISIKLRVGVPIMLSINIDQVNDLCNGTRLEVNDLGKNVIYATVITRMNLTLLIQPCFSSFKGGNFLYVYALE